MCLHGRWEVCIRTSKFGHWQARLTTSVASCVSTLRLLLMCMFLCLATSRSIVKRVRFVSCGMGGWVNETGGVQERPPRTKKRCCKLTMTSRQTDVNQPANMSEAHLFAGALRNSMRETQTQLSHTPVLRAPRPIHPASSLNRCSQRAMASDSQRKIGRNILRAFFRNQEACSASST